MADIIYSSAKSIAQAIQDREVSSVEVVQAHLYRIEEVNDRLNAVVRLCADRALEEAHEADAALARGESRGALHGVPMTLKDSLDTEGVVTTGGTLGRRMFVPERDSTVAARLRGAGAILLGKTNTPEFTLAGETGQPGVWAYQQPVRTRSHSGRVERWGRSDSRSRRVAVRHGQRHGRQHPAALALQRNRRHQAELGTSPSHRTRSPVRDGRDRRLHSERPDGALRRGYRPHAAEHFGAGLEGSGDRSDAAGRPGRRGSRYPAGRVLHEFGRIQGPYARDDRCGGVCDQGGLGRRRVGRGRHA